MLPESPVLLPGFQAFATPGTLPPSVTAPHLRPLPSTGITRLLQYSSLSATLPAQPPPHGVPVRCVPHHPQGFPCCCLLPLPCVPASLPRRVQRGARVARFPLRLRPSPFLRWVGPRIARFEACSTFTRVPARMLAEPPKAPKAALCHQGASDPIVASMIRPGCYQPERQLLDGFRTRWKKAPFHGALRNAG